MNEIQGTERPSTTPQRFPYERDLTRIFDDLGDYEAISHGFRLRFRVVERQGERGTYRLAIPLYFDAVHRERGRTVVDETVYVRHRDRRDLVIPLERLRGRGEILPSSRRHDEETCFLLADMESVIKGSIAWALLRYLDPPEPAVATH